VSQYTPVVLITGASRGRGRALVAAFLRRGCPVLGVVRSQLHAEELSRIHSQRFDPIVADIRSSELSTALRRTIDTRHGVLDVLVNNAGTRGHLTSIMQEPEISELFAVHCIGALRASRAALPFLQESQRGLVVNITSRFGSIARTAAGDFPGNKYSYSYRIAKAAQHMLTLCLSQQLWHHGIQSNHTDRWETPDF